MLRKLLFPVLLAFTIAPLAQTGSSPSNSNVAVPSAGVMVAPAETGTVAATPGITFVTPPPTAGISDAGRAGISNTAPTVLLTPNNPSTIVYVTGAPMTAAEAAGGPVAEMQPTETSTSDLGPSTFVQGNTIAAANARSLGEVAADYKARRGAQTARTITNADVLKITGNGANNTGGLQASSNQPATLMAQNQQPANPSSTAGAPLSASTQPQTQPPSQSAPANTGAGTQAQPQQPNAQRTTPQIQQEAQTPGAASDQQLPATSTLLPLLGVLGLAGSGAGMWLRRRRTKR